MSVVFLFSYTVRMEASPPHIISSHTHSTCKSVLVGNCNFVSLIRREIGLDYICQLPSVCLYYFYKYRSDTENESETDFLRNKLEREKGGRIFFVYIHWLNRAIISLSRNENISFPTECGWKGC